MEKRDAADPVLSIGLPVFNGERFLEETLRSILRQTFEDFELIICDNASTDKTADICREYEGSDGRVRYYRNEVNIGGAANYNKTFRLAKKGRYFKWAACDDILAPTFLEKCVEALEQRSDAVIAYTKSQLIDEEGRLLRFEGTELDLGADDVIVRYASTLDPMELCHNPVFGVMRREAIARTGLFGSFLASDRVFISEMSLQGPFIEVPEILFYRRKHAKNVGSERKHLGFYLPNVRKKAVFPEWRVLAEQARVIVRSSWDLGTKVQLMRVLMRWAIRRSGILLAQLGVGIRDVLVNTISWSFSIMNT